MPRKLLTVFLMLFGLALGAIWVSAQVSVPAEPATPATPVPLLSLGAADSSAIPEVNLQPGARSPFVKKVQEALKSSGYLPADLETTENLGPLTKQAIINFQKDHGLPAFGFWGPATRAALKNKLRGVGGTVIDKAVDIACMKAAVEKRENALLAAYDTLTQKVKAARETRKTDLLAAWSISEPKERHAAVKAAWEKYRESVKAARTEWNQTRKATWVQFAKDAKNCRASAAETQDLEILEVTEE